MQRLVADVEKDIFQAVLVWRISRLSRNMLDTLTLLDKFEDYGVKFISYSENFDTGSPIGRLVVQLMASIAEMERNTLSENVKLGMKQRALEGSWNGGVVFGYDTIEKELVINKEEAEVVKLIFQLYSNGKGLKAVANHLNKAGYRTKRNRHFSINGVATILDNVIYNGKISWLKIENWDTKRRRGKILILFLLMDSMKALYQMNCGVLFKQGERANHLNSVNQMNLFCLAVFCVALIVVKVWFLLLLHIHVKMEQSESTDIMFAVISIIKVPLHVKQTQ